jgi:uncharacterized protein YegJ (DUF2314 family)
MSKRIMATGVVALALAITVAHAQPPGPSRQAGNVHSVPVGDKATRDAEIEARRTFPIFLAKWRAKSPGYAAFRVKAEFATDDGRGQEVMWLEPMSVAADGSLEGVLSDDAVAITRLKMGSKVRVPAAKIADWMYIKDRKMFGQFTMRAQLNLASPQQRAQFDAMLSPAPLEPGDR